MRLIKSFIKGLSLIGIAATTGFQETDEAVLSIIDDVKNMNKSSDRVEIMGDFHRVRTDLNKAFNKYNNEQRGCKKD